MKRKLTDEQKLSRKEYLKEWRKNNKEKLAKWYREYRKLKPEVNKANTKKYRKNNPEKSKQSSKDYKKRNKNKVKEYAIKYRERRNELEAIKKANDPLYKLKCKIYSSISKIFYRKKIKKNSKTEKIIGCTFEEFKTYIEAKWESWMTWENRGLYNGELNFGWDIDHVIPMHTAKTEEDIIKLNHYTNLQPLCSNVNRNIKNRFY